LSNIVEEYFNKIKWYEVFNAIVLSPDTFKELLKICDDDKIEEIAIKLGRLVPYKSFMIRGEIIDDDFLSEQIVVQMSENGRWFDVIEQNNEEEYYFYISHNYGRKWSKFLMGYIKSMIDENTSLRTVFETQGNNILLRIKRARA
jgi:hypothetical protein